MKRQLAEAQIRPSTYHQLTLLWRQRESLLIFPETEGSRKTSASLENEKGSQLNIQRRAARVFTYYELKLKFDIRLALGEFL